MTVTSNDARTKWSEMIDASRNEPVTITRRGRAVAVLVKPEFFERAMDALEDLEDIEDAAEAAASDEPTISHLDLMRELGFEGS